MDKIGSKVRIGFIGAGFMGQLAHLQNYVQLPECEIVALAEQKPRLAERVAAAYGIGNVYTDFRKMLKKEKLHAVVASQQFSNHIHLVPEILEAGVHLFTEKPLCILPENGRHLAEAAAEHKLIHMVGYHKRSDLAVEYALKVIRKWRGSGEMGVMRYLRLTMPPGDWTCASPLPLATDEPAPAWETESRPEYMDERMFSDYVSFVNYYIHQVNLLRCLYGEDYTLEYADPSGVLLAAKSTGGVCGVIEMSPYSTTDGWQESALVCFEKGWVKIELPAPLACRQAGRVTVFEDNGRGGVFTVPRLPSEHAMKTQARNFLRAVRGEAAPPCDSAEAVKDLDIALEYILRMRNHA